MNDTRDFTDALVEEYAIDEAFIDREYSDEMDTDATLDDIEAVLKSDFYRYDVRKTARGLTANNANVPHINSVNIIAKPVDNYTIVQIKITTSGLLFNPDKTILPNIIKAAEKYQATGELPVNVKQKTSSYRARRFTR